MFDFTPNALTAGSVAWHHAMPEDGDLCYWLPSLGAGTSYPATIHLVRLRRNDSYSGHKDAAVWFEPKDLGPVTFENGHLLIPEGEGSMYGRLPGPYNSGTLVRRSPETDALAAMLALAIRERVAARHAVSVLTTAIRGKGE